MAKKLKVKVPKRIAGIKIPKAVRKGPAADFLNSSAGQVLLAEALVAFGGALASDLRKPDSRVRELLSHPVEGLKDTGRAATSHAAAAGDVISRESNRLSTAFSEALGAFRAALEREASQESTPDSASTTAADLQTEAPRAKKKSPGSTIETPSTPH